VLFTGGKINGGINSGREFRFAKMRSARLGGSEKVGLTSLLDTGDDPIEIESDQSE
jgi:hypothetical protein